MNTKTLAQYACIISVLFFIQSIVFALEWSANKTEPVSPVNYSAEAVYYFNITCNDANDISKAWLTFNGLNYFMSNESSEYFIELADLAAGTYPYNFTCNNTLNNINTTGTWNYIVNKNVPALDLWIDGNQGDVTVDKNWTVNLTAKTIDNKNVTIEMNCSNWNKTDIGLSYNLITLNCNEGVYNVTAFVNEDANYTSYQKTYFLTIAEKSPVNISKTDYPASPTTYSFNGKYQFNLTIQDGSFGNCSFDFNVTPYNCSTNYTLIDNNIRRYSITLENLPARTYNYSWFVNDINGSNYTSGAFNYVINRAPALHLSLNGVESSTTANYLTQTNATCWSNDTNLDNSKFRLDRILSGVPTQITATPTSYSYADIETNLGVSGYVYSCSIANPSFVENYENISRTLNIQEPPSNNTGGNQGNTASGSLYFSDFKELKVNAGETGSETFALKNTFASDQTNVNIYLSGEPVDKNWCSLDVKTITVPKSGSKGIKLTCSVPSDAQVKNYTLSVRAVSTVGTPSASAKLIVQPASVQQPTTTTTTIPEETENETTENVTAQETPQEETPTGFVLSPDMLPDAILVIGFISAFLIFIFRENVTETFQRLGGKKGVVSERKQLKLTFDWTDKLKKIYNRYNCKLTLSLKKQPPAEHEEKKA